MLPKHINNPLTGVGTPSANDAVKSRAILPEEPVVRSVSEFIPSQRLMLMYVHLKRLKLRYEDLRDKPWGVDEVKQLIEEIKKQEMACMLQRKREEEGEEFHIADTITEVRNGEQVEVKNEVKVKGRYGTKAIVLKTHRSSTMSTRKVSKGVIHRKSKKNKAKQAKKGRK